jgi:glycogen debranching enzyme
MQWHIEQFEDVMNEHGIGSISEIYDGNPPHQARGAISQAWSVGEIIRAMDVIDGFEAKEGRTVK